MTGRMNSTIKAALAALLVGAFAVGGAVKAEGALAIDTNQGTQYGWAVNYPTQADADRRALNECGYNCTIVMRFSNSCAAYAADQNRASTAYGWAYGFSSSSAAQNGAMRECQNRGGSGSYCIVRAWGCD